MTTSPTYRPSTPLYSTAPPESNWGCCIMPCPLCMKECWRARTVYSEHEGEWFYEYVCAGCAGEADDLVFYYTVDFQLTPAPREAPDGFTLWQ